MTANTSVPQRLLAGRRNSPENLRFYIRPNYDYYYVRLYEKAQRVLADTQSAFGEFAQVAWLPEEREWIQMKLTSRRPWQSASARQSKALPWKFPFN